MQWMMRILRIVIYSIVSLVLLAGCEQVSTPTVSPTVSPTIMFTATPDLKRTQQASLYQKIQAQIDDSITIEDGILVIQDNSTQITHLLDLSTNTRLPGINIKIMRVSVSPNRHRMIYEDPNWSSGYREGDILYWESLYEPGKKPRRFHTEIIGPLYHSPLEWINDSEVIFTELERTGYFPVGNIVMNVDTGETRTIVYDFIDKNRDYKSIGWVFAINTQMTKMVFPGYDWKCVLWDIDEKSQIAILDDIECRDRLPEWSRDGTRFITKGFSPQEIAVVDDTGTKTNLTHVSVHPGAVPGETWQWSPDERYIAFWVTNGANIRPSIMGLGIFDSVTGMVKDIRFPKDQVGEILLYAGYENVMIWSPDSRYILFSNYHDPNRVVLVDVANTTTRIYGDNIEVLGWLK
jgi:dipeptidyl aminopeptidase/acylaminoacyl peptidase